MAERGDQYFAMVRKITLPQKFIQNIPLELIVYHLPMSITIEEDDDELTYKPNAAYSEKLYKLREDEEEECLSMYIVEEQDEKTGCIKEEELTNIFFTILDLLSALCILPSMCCVYRGSSILVIPNNSNTTVTYEINLTFLFAPQTIVGNIRDFLDFIKFVDKRHNMSFSYCGRCTQLYSANTPPLGCPCLLEESSGDEGYDTD